MKSNGEQLTGQAFVQGFSSQYSHLSNSAWSWCLVMILESTVPFFCMEHLDWKNELDFLCQKSHIHYSAIVRQIRVKKLSIQVVLCHIKRYSQLSALRRFCDTPWHRP